MADGPLPVVAPEEIAGRKKEAANLCHLWHTVIDDDAKKR